jgi:hypothetical protein
MKPGNAVKPLMKNIKLNDVSVSQDNIQSFQPHDETQEEMRT